MTDDVLERVTQIVRDIAGPSRSPSEVGAETQLSDGGFWLDSIELFEVLLTCEAVFGRIFEGDWTGVAASLRTVGALAAEIRARLEERRHRVP